MANLVNKRALGIPFVEEDPIFNWVEKNWAQPCTEALPQPLHGMCMFVPALGLATMIILTVAMLVWCENRSKAKQLKEAKDAKKD